MYSCRFFRSNAITSNVFHFAYYMHYRYRPCQFLISTDSSRWIVDVSRASCAQLCSQCWCCLEIQLELAFLCVANVLKRAKLERSTEIKRFLCIAYLFAKMEIDGGESEQKRKFWIAMPSGGATRSSKIADKREKCAIHLCAMCISQNATDTIADMFAVILWRMFCKLNTIYLIVTGAIAFHSVYPPMFDMPLGKYCNELSSIVCYSWRRSILGDCVCIASRHHHTFAYGIRNERKKKSMQISNQNEKWILLIRYISVRTIELWIHMMMNGRSFTAWFSVRSLIRK